MYYSYRLFQIFKIEYHIFAESMFLRVLDVIHLVQIQNFVLFVEHFLFDRSN